MNMNGTISKKFVISVKDYLVPIITIIKYRKVKYHCNYTGKYRGTAHDICNLRYKISKEIPVVFHNGSTYDYHFIIKELAEEFEREFECLGENTEKYITFSVPIKKEITKKDKDGNDKATKISYKTKFIDSYRIMPTSLSSLDYMTTKDEKLIFRCFEFKNKKKKDFNKELIKRFANIYEFSNGDFNKFIWLLRKGAYSHECMDSWEGFEEKSLPDKEAF